MQFAATGSKRTRVITLAKVKLTENPGPPKLLISKARRINTLIFSIIVLAVFGVIIYSHLKSAHSLVGWTALIAPICFFGLLGLLIPGSEKWEYKPWQSQANHMETTTYE